MAHTPKWHAGRSKIPQISICRPILLREDDISKKRSSLTEDHKKVKPVDGPMFTSEIY